MSTVGGYHDARGGYHDARGEYYEYRGGNLHYRHSNGPLGHRMERHTCMGPTT